MSKSRITAMLMPGTDNFCISAASVSPGSSPSRPVCGPSIAAMNASPGLCAVDGVHARISARIKMVKKLRMLLLLQLDPVRQRVADPLGGQRHRGDAANQRAAA